MRKTIAVVVVMSLVLGGCATEGSLSAAGQPLTAVERAQAKCRTTLIATALLGAAVGAAASRNRGRGAAIGGGAGVAVGGAFCAVMLATANETDRRHLAEARLRALETGQMQSDRYTGDDGKLRLLTVSAEAVPVEQAQLPSSEAQDGPCRRLRNDVQVQTLGDAKTGELTCRRPDGSWHTVRPESVA